MEIIASVLLVASPWIIKGLTNVAKKVSLIRFADNKIFIVRIVVALLSFVVAIGHSVLSGEPVSQDVIGTFSESIIIFLGATGAYFFEKKSV